MQINHLDQGKFELKSKNARIITGEKIQINDFIIPGDGEYEIAEVSVELVDNVTIFNTEEMNIAYLDKRKKPLSDKQIERINGVDILFIPVGGDGVFDTKQAIEAINLIEPKIVIPMHYDNVDEFTRQEGVKLENLDVLKISKSQLNPDQRTIVVLSCKK